MVPDTYEEFLNQYYSGGWDALCSKHHYEGPATEEPMFVLFDAVNDEQFFIYSEDPVFIAQHSMPVFECISAWAMSKKAPRRSANVAAVSQGLSQVAPHSQAKGRSSSGPRKFKVPGETTDPAWKAIWQEVIRRSTADDAAMPDTGEVATVLTEFAKQISQKKFELKTARAPFVRVFKLDEYNDMEFTAPINAFLKGYGVGPDAPEEVAGSSRKRVRTAVGGRTRWETMSGW